MLEYPMWCIAEVFTLHVLFHITGKLYLNLLKCFIGIDRISTRWKVWPSYVLNPRVNTHKPSFAAFTAAALLAYVASSFAHHNSADFTHSSLQNSSSSLSLDGDYLWKAISNRLIRFRSGLCEKWACYPLLWLWLELLSCWEVNLCPSLQSFASSKWFSSRSVPYLLWPGSLSLLKNIQYIHTYYFSSASLLYDTVGVGPPYKNPNKIPFGSYYQATSYQLIYTNTQLQYD